MFIILSIASLEITVTNSRSTAFFSNSVHGKYKKRLIRLNLISAIVWEEKASCSGEDSVSISEIAANNK